MAMGADADCLPCYSFQSTFSPTSPSSPSSRATILSRLMSPKRVNPSVMCSPERVGMCRMERASGSALSGTWRVSKEHPSIFLQKTSIHISLLSQLLGFGMLGSCQADTLSPFRASPNRPTERRIPHPWTDLRPHRRPHRIRHLTHPCLSPSFPHPSLIRTGSDALFPT